MKTKPRKIGLTTATALVIGNMIGAGVYVLPVSLAEYGSVSLIGWILSAAGALVLARLFSNFSRMIVNKSGGPYVYTKEGFGDFISFLVAWGYWISVWVGNAAMTIAFLSALSVFFPVINENPFIAVSIGLSLIWLLTWVNSRGVKESGRIQVVTTVLKLLPLAMIIVFGAFQFDLSYFPEFNASDQSDVSVIPVVAALTLYAFLGVESATIPAENIKKPDVTIPRATMLGTILCTLFYILSTFILFGLLSREEIMSSPAPFALAAGRYGGEASAYFVAFGAAIAALGALNGWILISGQIPMATARDKLFPKIFKKENKKGMPGLGLIIGSILTSLLLLMNFSEKLAEQFEFIVLLTTVTALIPYLFTSASYALILIEKKWNTSRLFRQMILATLAFSYSIWSVIGSGEEAVYYGFLLLLMGIPFYVLMLWNRKKDKHDESQ